MSAAAATRGIGTTSSSRGATPQYTRVAHDRLRGIGAGKYPVGSLLPTEAELCKRYSVSRITARAALAELQSRGLVSRRAGIGTRVVQAEVHEHFVHVSDSVESVLQFTVETRFTLLSHRPVTADAALAETLQCPVGQSFVLIEGLRGKDRRVPMCLTRLHVPLVYAGVLEHIDGHRGSVMLLMEKMFDVRIDEMREIISAANLRASEARLLAASPREAALVTRRWHLGANARLLLASVSLYPHRRYSYALRMRRQAALQAGAA